MATTKKSRPPVSFQLKRWFALYRNGEVLRSRKTSSGRIQPMLYGNADDAKLSQAYQPDDEIVCVDIDCTLTPRKEITSNGDE